MYKALIIEKEVPTDVDDNMYDHRFFWADNDGIGDSTCAIAKEAALRYLRALPTTVLQLADLVAVLKTMPDNPSTAGYATENSVIQVFAERGAGGVHPEYSHSMKVSNFSGALPTEFPEEDGDYLYTPTLFNHKAIDCFIVRVSTIARGRRKHVAITAIQITLNKKTHSPSEDHFVTICPELVSIATDLLKEGVGGVMECVEKMNRSSNGMLSVPPSIEMAVDVFYARYKPVE